MQEYEKRAEEDAAPAHEQAQPEARHGGGVRVLKYYLKTQGPSDVAAIVHIMKSFPGDHAAMVHLLHQQLGNAYVQRVNAELAGGNAQPIAPTPTADASAVEAPDIGAIAPAAAMPDLMLGNTTLPAPPEAAAANDSAAHEAEVDTGAGERRKDSPVKPEVYAKYVEAARKFLVWRFHLTQDQGAQLQFHEGAIVGSALNFDVTNFPEVTIEKPESTRSPMEKTPNFYTNLPKDIRPPGAGHVAHVMYDPQPVDGQPGMVKVAGGKISMHFDIGNPEDVVGGVTHIFGDLFFGQLRQHLQGKKPTPLK